MEMVRWFDNLDRGGENARLFALLKKERVIFEAQDPEDLADLRADGARIARDMDDPERPPPMLWSGIPLPPVAASRSSCDYHLVISVGGTKTEFALLRLDRGRVRALDLRTGKEASDPEEIARLKDAVKMNTPAYGRETTDGNRMVPLLVAHMAKHLEPHRGAALERCQGILLSWGFAHEIVRTGPRLAGGLTGRVTVMSKDQSKFTKDLAGKNIGLLFDAEFKAQLGWSRPIAIANDTIMALYYFLGPEWRPRFNSIGLFINGTGSNFALAEPFAVGREGIIVGSGVERRIPDLLTSRRSLKPGEREEPFFVNYESGTIELQATRTRFDLETEYQIERNALAGVKAFTQQLRGFTGAFLSEELYRKLRDTWTRAAKASSRSVSDEPSAPEVNRLSSGDGSPASAGAVFGGVPLTTAEAAALRLFARAIVHRSALHAALILYAVTLRRGYGRGGQGGKGGGGKPDLVGMEGSLWRIPGYQKLVRDWWQALLGKEPLQVEFGAEPGYNASLPGPLYLAALHQEADRET